MNRISRDGTVLTWSLGDLAPGAVDYQLCLRSDFDPLGSNTNSTRPAAISSLIISRDIDVDVDIVFTTTRLFSARSPDQNDDRIQNHPNRLTGALIPENGTTLSLTAKVPLRHQTRIRAALDDTAPGMKAKSSTRRISSPLATVELRWGTPRLISGAPIKEEVFSPGGRRGSENRLL